ncbi:MAG: hypothetical protein U0103_12065 [Candidatus Obscuribacterales bacterium]
MSLIFRDCIFRSAILKAQTAINAVVEPPRSASGKSVVAQVL